MSKGPVVRSVQRSDFDQWSPLWYGYNAFYGRSGPTALPDDITQMTWARFFDSYEPVHALVAELDGALVGLAHYLFHRDTIMIGPTCYMQDLFTKKDLRGKGVGRALIDAVAERARAAGCEGIYWHTHETNATAMRLYDKVAELSGFVLYSKTV